MSRTKLPRWARAKAKPEKDAGITIIAPGIFDGVTLEDLKEMFGDKLGAPVYYCEGCAETFDFPLTTISVFQYSYYLCSACRRHYEPLLRSGVLP